MTLSASGVRYATAAARGAHEPRFRELLRQLERTFLDDVMASADAQEGVAAFVAKRPPVWVDA